MTSAMNQDAYGQPGWGPAAGVFDAEARAFGHQGARILDVVIEDAAGNRLPALVGGEDVVLRIRAEALGDVTRPIMGFQIKDRPTRCKRRADEKAALA